MLIDTESSTAGTLMLTVMPSGTTGSKAPPADDFFQTILLSASTTLGWLAVHSRMNVLYGDTSRAVTILGSTVTLSTGPEVKAKQYSIGKRTPQAINY